MQLAGETQTLAIARTLLKQGMGGEQMRIDLGQLIARALGTLCIQGSGCGEKLEAGIDDGDGQRHLALPDLAEDQVEDRIDHKDDGGEVTQRQLRGQLRHGDHKQNGGEAFAIKHADQQPDHDLDRDQRQAQRCPQDVAQHKSDKAGYESQQQDSNHQLLRWRGVSEDPAGDCSPRDDARQAKRFEQIAQVIRSSHRWILAFSAQDRPIVSATQASDGNW